MRASLCAWHGMRAGAGPTSQPSAPTFPLPHSCATVDSIPRFESFAPPKGCEEPNKSCELLLVVGRSCPISQLSREEAGKIRANRPFFFFFFFTKKRSARNLAFSRTHHVVLSLFYIPVSDKHKLLAHRFRHIPQDAAHCNRTLPGPLHTLPQTVTPTPYQSSSSPAAHPVLSPSGFAHSYSPPRSRNASSSQ